MSKNEILQANLTRRKFLGGASTAALSALVNGAESSRKQWQSEQGSCSFRGDKLNVDYAAYLSKHDIVYLSPATEGYDGFPIGNGDLAGRVWTPPNRLQVVINKSNTWDDFPDDRPSDAENITALRSAGALSIENGTPSFDWMYLDDFAGRLSLYEAEVRFRARTAQAETSVSLWVDAHSNVLVVDYEDRTDFETERKIRLERWGSRIFRTWYAAISRDTALGLGGTRAFMDERDIWVEQQLRSLRFVVALRVLGSPTRKEVINLHRAEISLPRSQQARATLFVAVVTSEDHPEPLKRAKELLDAAESAGTERLRARHRSYWSDFWSRSFINISDDYLENLWYFNLYQMGSSSRGPYPPPFCGGSWNWNHDVRQWNWYYHYNQRCMNWPLEAANHPELMTPYFELCTRALPKAEEAAHRYPNAQGAVYAVVTNRRGDQFFAWGKIVEFNWTPGTQSALSLYRHYLYTQDKNFLRGTAYPVMKACSLFYLSQLKREPNGNYYLPESSPLENSTRLRNCLVDLIEIKASFKALVECSKALDVDEDLRGRWQDVLDHFPAYLVRDVGADTFIHVLAPRSEPPLLIRMKPTEPLEGTVPNPSYLKAPGKMFCLGVDEEGNEVFEDTFGRSLSLTYPNGEAGLEDQGTELYEVALNTTRFISRGNCAGAIEAPTVALARLGQGQEAYEGLLRWVRINQHFPQGLFYDEQQVMGSNRYFKQELPEGLDRQVHAIRECYYSSFLRYEDVRVKETGTRLDLPMKPFIQTGLTPMGIFQTAINEMLLHSYRGKIRVFPAVPPGWGGKFTLRAEGAFLVTSEMDSGQPVKYVAVQSLAGAPCAVVNPWEEKVNVLDAAEGNRKVGETGDKLISFSTQKGHTYVVERAARPLKDFQMVKVTGSRNERPKGLREAILGKSRDF